MVEIAQIKKSNKTKGKQDNRDRARKITAFSTYYFTDNKSNKSLTVFP